MCHKVLLGNTVLHESMIILGFARGRVGAHAYRAINDAWSITLVYYMQLYAKHVTLENIIIIIATLIIVVEVIP